MLLKRLEVRNMRKIKQADIEFHGAGVKVIQGANMSGKTTVAQSIALTMNGPKDYTSGMITHGEEKAEIIAYTDDGLQIRTVVSDSVKQTVQRYDESLRRFVSVSGGVRAFLNSICSGLEMPWSLRDMTDAKIIEMVKNRSGLTEKIAAIDFELKEKEAQRMEIGRDKKRMGEPGEAPEKVEHPVSIDYIRSERQKVKEYLEWKRQLFVSCSESLREKCEFDDFNDFDVFKEAVEQARLNIVQSLDSREKQNPTKRPPTQNDLDELEKRFAEWVDTEQAAKNYDAFLEKKNEWDRLVCLYDDLISDIEALREKRKKALSDMNLGVKGLEIGEDNCLYHNGAMRGITETQKSGNWSTAESVQIFFGLGARFSGNMKVLVVDNAESLDTKTTEAITKWAESAGFLVIMLKVAEVPETLEEGIIYIKEGEIVAK